MHWFPKSSFLGFHNTDYILVGYCFSIANQMIQVFRPIHYDLFPLVNVGYLYRSCGMASAASDYQSYEILL